MATATGFSPNLQLFLLFALFLIPLSISSPQDEDVVTDVHDLFPKYNLPKGLLPENVKSYSLSSLDSSFKIELTHQCYVKFNDQLVLYDSIIRGKLGYGIVSDVTGIHAKKLFVWVPVTGMYVDQSGTMIDFYVGVLSQRLPFEDFLIIPSCLNNGFQEPLQAYE